MNLLTNHTVSPKEKNITVICDYSINNTRSIHVCKFGLSLSWCLMDLSADTRKEVPNGSPCDAHIQMLQ
jgi:hypothetical protein